jgi:hypothetical protein
MEHGSGIYKRLLMFEAALCQLTYFWTWASNDIGQLSQGKVTSCD